VPLFGSRASDASPPQLTRWQALPGPDGGFSTGIPELDTRLGGGYRYGSLHVVEADNTAGPEDFWILVLPVVLDAVAHGRGALIAPPPSLPAERTYERLVAWVPADFVRRRIRIVDYAAAQPLGPWHLPMARFGRVEAVRAMIRAERDVAGTPARPFFTATALDSLVQSLGGEAAARVLPSGYARLRSGPNAELVWSRSGPAIARDVAAMADTYLVFSRSNGRAVLRGIRPAFASAPILWDDDGRSPLHVGLGRPGDLPLA
jgi:hypothetical protein